MKKSIAITYQRNKRRVSATIVHRCHRFTVGGRTDCDKITLRPIQRNSSPKTSLDSQTGPTTSYVSLLVIELIFSIW